MKAAVVSAIVAVASASMSMPQQFGGSAQMQFPQQMPQQMPQFGGAQMQMPPQMQMPQQMPPMSQFGGMSQVGSRQETTTSGYRTLWVPRNQVESTLAQNPGSHIGAGPDAPVPPAGAQSQFGQFPFAGQAATQQFPGMGVPQFGGASQFSFGASMGDGQFGAQLSAPGFSGSVEFPTGNLFGSKGMLPAGQPFAGAFGAPQFPPQAQTSLSTPFAGSSFGGSKFAPQIQAGNGFSQQFAQPARFGAAPGRP